MCLSRLDNITTPLAYPFSNFRPAAELRLDCQGSRNPFLLNGVPLSTVGVQLRPPVHLETCSATIMQCLHKYTRVYSQRRVALPGSWGAGPTTTSLIINVKPPQTPSPFPSRSPEPFPKSFPPTLTQSLPPTLLFRPISILLFRVPVFHFSSFSLFSSTRPWLIGCPIFCFFFTIFQVLAGTFPRRVTCYISSDFHSALDF